MTQTRLNMDLEALAGLAGVVERRLSTEVTSASLPGAVSVVLELLGREYLKNPTTYAQVIVDVPPTQVDPITYAESLT